MFEKMSSMVYSLTPATPTFLMTPNQTTVTPLALATTDSTTMATGPHQGVRSSSNQLRRRSGADKISGGCW